MNHEGDQNMQPNTEEMDTREAEAQPTLDNGLHVVNNKVEDNDVVMASSRDETNNSSAAENNEESGEEDEARSSATFQFTVENFSKLKESALSPPCFVRSLPWKIMVMSRVQQNDRHNQQRTVGIFLQCNAESESTWSCQATAELRLMSCKPGMPPHGRKIQHLFYNKENDWGFSNFLAWNEITDPEKGYYNAKEDSITVQVHVVADAPHGVSWDSKKHTGYVGLKNQGATCYMNSLLQTLFFTNQLRKAVYLMPTDNDDPSKSVALGLQRVFYDLQFGDKPVGTKKLTKSFGWDAIDSFMQHDVQELCRVLLDNMESKMKGTCVEGTIPRLFEGKMLSFIKCKHIEYMSSRQEPYYDIQLNIKGKKNIYESFKDYVTVENMDGENKYDAGDHGLQEAEKGVVFLSLPPVLVLQLMRFQYDPATDTNIKINDRCEFPTKLDLDPFLQQADPNDPAHYVLHAVLVHSGDNHGGHYVVYINPRGDGKWCKFDDDVVSRATRKEATENNYGGNDDDVSIRFCTNAYMLTYLRESQLDKLVEPVKEEDIPASLKQRFVDEKLQEAQKRKERLEAHLYLNVNIVLEDDFVGHQGPDLIDIEKCNLRTFKEKKTSTVRQLLQNLADALKYPVNQIRPWLFQSRKNNTFRPAHFALEHYLDKTVEEVDDHTMTFFIETAKPGSKAPLPAFDKDREVLFFLKRYDPKTSSVTYSGHICWPITRSLSDMRPMLCELSGYPKNSNLLFFEEVKPDCVDPIEEPGAPLESLVEELMDGDIIIYQREDPDFEHYPLPTARDYFRDLYYRIEIIFYDRAQPTDPGFTLTLSLKDNYDRLARAVGDHLNIDPFMIQFFRPANPNSGGFGREVNYTPVRYTFDGTLKEMFMTYQKPRTVRKLYYQKLTIRIDELENKRQLKCLWVSYNLKDEKELVLYPDKNGKVSDIFAEARKQLGSASAGQKLRMLEISSSRLSALVREDVILENFNNLGTKVYRIEEVPQDEATLSDDECLVPVAHFHKEPFQTFGTPFLFKVRNGELFSRVKERIQKRLEVPDKDFEKYRFAIVTSSRATFIPEDANYKVDIQSFIVRGQQQNTSFNMRPWLGLEHINKTVKRYNVSYHEKAIKILN